MDKLEMKELISAAEGILFASGEPVDIDRIALALELDRDTAEEVLKTLEDQYAYERRGIRLIRMDDSWQLCSAPEYGDIIRVDASIGSYYTAADIMYIWSYRIGT